MSMYNAESRQPMDGGAKKLRRIGNFEKIAFQLDQLTGLLNNGSAIVCTLFTINSNWNWNNNWNNMQTNPIFCKSIDVIEK